jgi:hypothetical protein
MISMSASKVPMVAARPDQDHDPRTSRQRCGRAPRRCRRGRRGPRRPRGGRGSLRRGTASCRGRSLRPSPGTCWPRRGHVAAGHFAGGEARSGGNARGDPVGPEDVPEGGDLEGVDAAAQPCGMTWRTMLSAPRPRPCRLRVVAAVCSATARATACSSSKREPFGRLSDWTVAHAPEINAHQHDYDRRSEGARKARR